MDDKTNKGDTSKNWAGKSIIRPINFQHESQIGTTMRMHEIQRGMKKLFDFTPEEDPELESHTPQKAGLGKLAIDSAELAAGAMLARYGESLHVSLEANLDKVQITPKGNDFRIAITDDKMAPEKREATLEGILKQLKEHDPDHAAQMGGRIVRNTLIITNPTNDVKKLLKEQHNQQKQAEAGRG